MTGGWLHAQERPARGHKRGERRSRIDRRTILEDVASHRCVAREQPLLPLADRKRVVPGDGHEDPVAVTGKDGNGRRAQLRFGPRGNGEFERRCVNRPK